MWKSEKKRGLEDFTFGLEVLLKIVQVPHVDSSFLSPNARISWQLSTLKPIRTF
jgi:hypothetical protein